VGGWDYVFHYFLIYAFNGRVRVPEEIAGAKAWKIDSTSVDRWADLINRGEVGAADTLTHAIQRAILEPARAQGREMTAREAVEQMRTFLENDFFNTSGLTDSAQIQKWQSALEILRGKLDAIEAAQPSEPTPNPSPTPTQTPTPDPAPALNDGTQYEPSRTIDIFTPALDRSSTEYVFTQEDMDSLGFAGLGPDNPFFETDTLQVSFVNLDGDAGDYTPSIRYDSSLNRYVLSLATESPSGQPNTDSYLLTFTMKNDLIDHEILTGFQINHYLEDFPVA
jgi:hypothetical protein